jgi:hypothetical protein
MWKDAISDMKSVIEKERKNRELLIGRAGQNAIESAKTSQEFSAMAMPKASHGKIQRQTAQQD